MGVSAGVQVVTVGVPAGTEPDPEGAAVAQALADVGAPVASRVAIEDDEGALERALAPDDGLTVVLAAAGAGDLVRRVVARAMGARLVLSERFLAALEEGYRRLDRPLPRRAERLALLPQGAQAWTTEHGEPGFVLESGARAVVVLARDGALRTAVERHLVPYARARAAGPGAGFLRTLRTAGVTAGELEERLAEGLGPPAGPARGGPRSGR